MKASPPQRGPLRLLVFCAPEELHRFGASSLGYDELRARIAVFAGLGARAALVVRAPDDARAEAALLGWLGRALAERPASARPRLGLRVASAPSGAQVAAVRDAGVGFLHLGGAASTCAEVASWRAALDAAGLDDVGLSAAVGDGRREGGDLPLAADNLLASPVWATASKPGVATIGLDGLAALAASHSGVLGLGGVEPASVAALLATGAAGIACWRAAWRAPVDAWQTACARLAAAEAGPRAQGRSP